MLDLSLLAEPLTWWFVAIFVMSFLMIYTTRNIVMAMIPAVTITAYMSISGFLPLWYGWVVLLILSVSFAVLFVLPIVKHIAGGGSE